VERLKARTRPVDVWYLDLKLLEEYYDGPHKYHHTAPVSLFYALREALAIIAEEGLENRYRRHRNSHVRLVEGLERMGLSMLVDDGNRLWNLNTPRVPDGLNDVSVRTHLMEKRSDGAARQRCRHGSLSRGIPGSSRTLITG
jgi:alanine-glyoxylate transaminase/serine-glyoxylate transaminase/serine-pyruvate transaminase